MDSPPIAPPVAPSDDGARPPPLGRRLTQRRTLVSFAIGFAVLFLAYQRLNVDLGATLAAMGRTNVLLYAAAVVIFYAGFIFRSLRWRVLLRNVGFHAHEGVELPPLSGLGRIILLSWFVNCLVPAKLGDAYRAYLLKRDAGVSFSKTVGTVLAERIFDLLILFALLGAAAILAFGARLPEAVLSLVEVALGLAVLLIVGLGVMRLLGGRIRTWLPLRLQSKYGLFEEGTLGSFQALPLLTLLTVIIWASEGGRLYLVMLALGVDQLHPAVPIFVSLAGALLTTVPVTPAGLGFVESGLVSLLLLAAGVGLVGGLSRELALSVALLDRSISYASLVIVGGALHLWRGTR